jgi:hypothetical protein
MAIVIPTGTICGALLYKPHHPCYIRFPYRFRMRQERMEPPVHRDDPPGIVSRLGPPLEGNQPVSVCAESDKETGG